LKKTPPQKKWKKGGLTLLITWELRMCNRMEIAKGKRGGEIGFPTGGRKGFTPVSAHLYYLSKKTGRKGNDPKGEPTNRFVYTSERLKKTSRINPHCRRGGVRGSLQAKRGRER